MDDGSPQVKKPSSKKKQPKRPQREKANTTVPCDSAQTKTGIKLEQGSSWASSDSRKSRHSRQPPQVEAECNNQFEKGSTKSLHAEQAKSKTSSGRKTSYRKQKVGHDSDTKSSKSTSVEPESSAHPELSRAITKENMSDSSIAGKNAKKSSQGDGQRFSRRDIHKYASTKHVSASIDSKKTSGHAEPSQAKAKEGISDSPIVEKNARKDSSVEAHSRRDKHTSTQHSSTSSYSKKSSSYLEPFRANAEVESKGSRKTSAKKKKDFNLIHSNSENTALAAKERSYSLQNSKQTDPSDSPVVRKSHKEGPSTESLSGRKKKAVDKRPQSNASTFSANKVRSVSETQAGPSSKRSSDCVSLKDANERFSDIKSFSCSPSAKREPSGSRRSPSASIEKMNERPQSPRSSRASSSQLEATQILQRVHWISSRRSISSIERADKRASSACSPRASRPTQFEVLDSSKTFTFASPSYPQLRSRTSHSKTSLNKLEVLNTNDKQQKTTSPKQPSGKLQKAGPTKKRSSDAGVAKWL